mmetsp:Transcript_6980/g.15295  ORF Transcript_6980/g.15295 Transcript_6980/m.15295 type:complete len:234 (-) Transcript_6980:155-856(-)
MVRMEKGADASARTALATPPAHTITDVEPMYACAMTVIGPYACPGALAALPVAPLASSAPGGFRSLPWMIQYKAMPTPCMKSSPLPTARLTLMLTASFESSESSSESRSCIRATPPPARSAERRAENVSLSVRSAAARNAAVVGSMHWKSAAVCASVSATPKAKHSWNAPSTKPRAAKRKRSFVLLGNLSGDSNMAATAYRIGNAMSSLAVEKARGSMPSSESVRAAIMFHPE